MSQTALDFFMNSLNAESYTSDFWKAYKKAKEMEYEQMCDVYTEGFKRKAFVDDLVRGDWEERWSNGFPEDFETYYNKTYGE